MKSWPHFLVRSFMYPKAENNALASRLDTGSSTMTMPFFMSNFLSCNDFRK